MKVPATRLKCGRLVGEIIKDKVFDVEVISTVSEAYWHYVNVVLKTENFQVHAVITVPSSPFHTEPDYPIRVLESSNEPVYLRYLKGVTYYESMNDAFLFERNTRKQVRPKNVFLFHDGNAVLFVDIYLPKVFLFAHHIAMFSKALLLKFSKGHIIRLCSSSYNKIPTLTDIDKAVLDFEEGIILDETTIQIKPKRRLSFKEAINKQLIVPTQDGYLTNLNTLLSLEGRLTYYGIYTHVIDEKTLLIKPARQLKEVKSVN